MTTRRSIIIIVIAAIVALALQVALGTFLSAKLSTWPVLRRLDFLNPQAPIVINNREVVRVSDSGDLVDVVNNTKTKLSAVVAIQNNAVTVVGTALNITSDGVFLTAYNNFAPKANYAVVLNSGQIAAVREIVVDPATKLVFLTTFAGDAPIAAFGESKTLAAGEKVALVHATLIPANGRFSAGYVNSGQDDTWEKIVDASRPSRSFGLNASNGSVSGSAVVNVSGEIMGIWAGDRVISSDVIKTVLSLYFANKTKIARPEIGFSYQFLGPAQATLLATVSGARVSSVNKPAPGQDSPAQAAGLQAGDVIIQANGTKIDRAAALEEITDQIKPGQSLTMEVMRGSKQITIALISGELK